MSIQVEHIFDYKNLLNRTIDGNAIKIQIVTPTRNRIGGGQRPKGGHFGN